MVCHTCKKENKADKYEYWGEISRLLEQRIRENKWSIIKKKILLPLSIHTIENEHSFNFEGKIIFDFEMKCRYQKKN